MSAETTESANKPTPTEDARRADEAALAAHAVPVGQAETAARPETAAQPETTDKSSAPGREAAGADTATKPEPDSAPAAAASSAPEPRLQAVSGSGAKVNPADDMEVAVVPGITRYHRTDCLLIRFLTGDDLDLMSKQAAKDGGCVPCKACKPDQETADAAVG